MTSNMDFNNIEVIQTVMSMLSTLQTETMILAEDGNRTPEIIPTTYSNPLKVV